MINDYSIFDRIQFKLAQHLNKNHVPSKLSSPIISFSFDDFPKSAAEIGAAYLEKNGFRGTFYAAGALNGTTQDGIQYYDDGDIANLIAVGHEIGCHTFNHHNLMRLSADQVSDEFTRNREYFGSRLKENDFSSFAYPLGAVSPSVKSAARGAYPICRGAWSGMNAGRVDMSLLKVIPLEPAQLSRDQTLDLFEDARAQNAWMIFMVHDIQNDHSNCGTTPTHFREIVDLVAASGIEVLPVKSAAAKVVFG